MENQLFTANIKILLTAGKLHSAVEELVKFLASHASDDLYNCAIQLSGHFARVEAEYHKGLISAADREKERLFVTNTILEHVLPKISQLQQSYEAPELGSVGKLLHNVPAKMFVGTPTRCTVRIAKDVVHLLENFSSGPDSIITDIEIAKVMEVQIFGMEGNVFTIEGSSHSAQAISTSRFNEWIFHVTPHQQGHFHLILRINIVETIDGKEYPRDTVLEQAVEVTTSLPVNFFTTSTGWQYASVQVNYLASKKIPVVLPEVEGKWNGRNRIVRIAIWVALGMLLALLGYCASHRFWHSGTLSKADPPVQKKEWKVFLHLAQTDDIKHIQLDSISGVGYEVVNDTLLALSVPPEFDYHEFSIFFNAHYPSTKSSTISRDSQHLFLEINNKIIHNEPLDFGLGYRGSAPSPNYTIWLVVPLSELNHFPLNANGDRIAQVRINKKGDGYKWKFLHTQVLVTQAPPEDGLVYVEIGYPGTPFKALWSRRIYMEGNMTIWCDLNLPTYDERKTSKRSEGPKSTPGPEIPVQWPGFDPFVPPVQNPNDHKRVPIAYTPTNEPTFIKLLAKQMNAEAVEFLMEEKVQSKLYRVEGRESIELDMIKKIQENLEIKHE